VAVYLISWFCESLYGRVRSIIIIIVIIITGIFRVAYSNATTKTTIVRVSKAVSDSVVTAAEYVCLQMAPES